MVTAREGPVAALSALLDQRGMDGHAGVSDRQALYRVLFRYAGHEAASAVLFGMHPDGVTQRDRYLFRRSTSQSRSSAQ